MSHLMRKILSPYVVFMDEADDGTGSKGTGGTGDDDAAKAAKAKADAEAEAARKAEEDKKKKGGPTDEEAKLIKEVMEKKTLIRDLQDKLKSFEGIDPAKVKELLDAQAKAEQEKKAAEEKRLMEQGQFDKIKEQMLAEHDKTVKGLQEQLKGAVDSNSALNTQIADLTVGAAFSSSEFVKEEMALTPTKARVVYGSYFSFENGRVVGYDKPAGASDRTMLVDGRGNPLPFEEAIQKVIESDPEKDHLIKSKMKTGAGSNTEQSKQGVKTQTELRGASKIAAALGSKSKK